MASKFRVTDELIFNSRRQTTQYCVLARAIAQLAQDKGVNVDVMIVSTSGWHVRLVSADKTLMVRLPMDLADLAEDFDDRSEVVFRDRYLGREFAYPQEVVDFLQG